VKLIQNSALVQEMKKALLPGIFAMMDACSAYEFLQLNTTLDPTGKAIFKAIHTQYQDEHKYTGKT